MCRDFSDTTHVKFGFVEDFVNAVDIIRNIKLSSNTRGAFLKRP